MSCFGYRSAAWLAASVGHHQHHHRHHDAVLCASCRYKSLLAVAIETDKNTINYTLQTWCSKLSGNSHIVQLNRRKTQIYIYLHVFYLRYLFSLLLCDLLSHLHAARYQSVDNLIHLCGSFFRENLRQLILKVTWQEVAKKKETKERGKKKERD